MGIIVVINANGVLIFGLCDWFECLISISQKSIKRQLKSSWRNVFNILMHILERFFILFDSTWIENKKTTAKKNFSDLTISCHLEFDAQAWSCKDTAFWHHTVCVFMSYNCRNSCQKKAEFVITMRATKSFDTILFVSSCLQISDNPVKKGRISYHNESN